MFILLNNVPINTLDITKVSSVFKVSPTHIFPLKNVLRMG